MNGRLNAICNENGINNGLEDKALYWEPLGFDWKYLGKVQTSRGRCVMLMLKKTSRLSSNILSVQNNMHLKDDEDSTAHGWALQLCPNWLLLLVFGSSSSSILYMLPLTSLDSPLDGLSVYRMHNITHHWYKIWPACRSCVACSLKCDHSRKHFTS